MVKQRKKGSIIDHTTTCPYCGHRVLHKNLHKHINDQHPVKSTGNKFIESIKSNEPFKCPYCEKEMRINDYEEHVCKYHIHEIIEIDKRLYNERVLRERSNLKRRKKLAKDYDAILLEDKERDPEVPYEWKIAESEFYRSVKTKKKTKVQRNKKQSKKQNEFTTCPVCNVELKLKRLDKHIKKVHKEKLRVEKLLQDGGTRNRLVSCPICNVDVKTTRLENHIIKAHKEKKEVKDSQQDN